MSVVEQTDAVTLTPSAAEAVQDLLNQKNLQGYGLRVFISGGGCSGYQLGLALDNRFRPEDQVFEELGIKVLVDEVSINYLRGASIDFVKGAEGSGFKVTNPNPMPSCSCESSGASDEDADSGCGGGCNCGN